MSDELGRVLRQQAKADEMRADAARAAEDARRAREAERFVQRSNSTTDLSEWTRRLMDLSDLPEAEQRRLNAMPRATHATLMSWCVAVGLARVAEEERRKESQS